MSQRAAENREKWRTLVVKSSSVPPTTPAVKGQAKVKVQAPSSVTAGLVPTMASGDLPCRRVAHVRLIGSGGGWHKLFLVEG